MTVIPIRAGSHVCYAASRELKRQAWCALMRGRYSRAAKLYLEAKAKWRDGDEALQSEMRLSVELVKEMTR